MSEEIHLWGYDNCGVNRNRIYIVPDAKFSSEADRADIRFIDISEGCHVDPIREERVSVLKADYHKIKGGRYHTLWGTLLEKGYIGKVEPGSDVNEYDIEDISTDISHLMGYRKHVHDKGRDFLLRLKDNIG